MVTFFLTHKGNFSIFLPRKSNVLSINSRPIILTIQNIRDLSIYTVMVEMWRFLIIKRMLENTFESVKEMVIFCGIIANEARLKKAVKLCSFERLKKVESEYGSEDEYSPNMKFFHEGRSGQWKIYFSNSQLKSSYDREGDALSELNYID